MLFCLAVLSSEVFAETGSVILDAAQLEEAYRRQKSPCVNF